MGTMIKVIDRRTEQERLVTHAAYAAQGPKAYQKLAVVTVNEQGEEIGVASSPNSNTAQAQQVRNVKGAAPVVVRTQLVSPPVETEEKPAEQNITPLEAASEATPTETPAPAATERKKPGPKGPRKSKANSSADTAEEK